MPCSYALLLEILCQHMLGMQLRTKVSLHLCCSCLCLLQLFLQALSLQSLHDAQASQLQPCSVWRSGLCSIHNGPEMVGMRHRYTTKTFYS